ncbi:uncharacterized protein LOC106764684 isoform X2 [Vigna radiata var. radiata]|uniref:Uncharacterized protein LOC106764684 isoform X2 n=1 Tax=Vigna radiata var. radiata TaxID=3916 RepID=A0A3Q0F590_VIGRR|nr:uncharacterized protein LOC106764684 isoform X2 [Vigna radiata var. radiata]XP_022637775.1 uncharacterized protein LOC106764684 isoform X2 [Vigna radiata var. radiata]XP_022637776.1 uncharacterized protein LOC106764684 isoform X2 [Vigna radiata var. radiata]
MEGMVTYLTLAKENKKSYKVFYFNLPAEMIDCIEKVEQVVRIKQKQEEDKAAVKLHSFNPAFKINEAAHKSTKTERMRILRSTSSTRKKCEAAQQARDANESKSPLGTRQSYDGSNI